MPKRWVVFLIIPIYLVIVSGLAALVEGYLSRAVAGILGTLGIALIGWVLFSLYGSATIFWGGRDTNDAKIQRYLRWLIQETEYHVMDGVGQVTRDRDPEINDLFCDISSYGINERRLSLSAWLSETTVGHEPYGAFLLGPPGSGKSVTLRAVLLSCANSSFLYGSLLGKMLGRGRTRGSSEWLRSVHTRFGKLFDSTWLIPAVAFVPILVDLRANERIFEKYLDGDKKDLQKDLLEPVLENCGGLEFQQFQALLRTGRIALLCDGLDELKNQDLRLAVIEFIKSVFTMGKPGRNFFLVTCRSGSFNDLRDSKPRDFKEVTLETLLAEDKSRIVRKLLLSELPRNGKSTRELIMAATARPEVRRMRGRVGSQKQLHRTLIDDLVEEIITRVPKGFPTWRPSDFPLSLRRMTSVLVPRQSKDVRLFWEPHDERPRWKLEIGALSDSMGEYTKIIEQDLLEFLRRRKKFAEHNDYSDDQMLLFYGELVYDCQSLPHTFTREELKNFVERKAKTNLSLEDQLDAFKAHGILTEVGGKGAEDRFAFRDDESASLVTALYMLDRDAPERIDTYISKGHDTKETAMPILMAFSRLRGEALTSFVRKSKYFSDPVVLQSAVFGGVGTQPHGRLSKDEADAFLERALLEVEKQKENERTLALWVLIRHLIFNRWSSPGWAPQRFLEILKSPKVPSCNRAQIILLLAELANSQDEDLRSEEVELAIDGWINCEDVLVRACAALAMNYLLGDRPEYSLETDRLSTIVSHGTYFIGDELSDFNPLDEQFVGEFRLARFPVVRFQFERWKNGGSANTNLGDAFMPIVGLSPADAMAFAQGRGARLPTATEFEVAAAYSGSSLGRRAYPWGDQIMAAQFDVLLEKKSLREILGDRDEALTIGLKPTLATPSGIFDLVSNVWQLTSDRPQKVLKEPELLVFGATISSSNPYRFRCFNRAPLAADRGHKGVGFRLAWNVRQED